MLPVCLASVSKVGGQISSLLRTLDELSRDGSDTLHFRMRSLVGGRLGVRTLVLQSLLLTWGLVRNEDSTPRQSK
eukprot:3613181-Amphidinium_carterae.2